MFSAWHQMIATIPATCLPAVVWCLHCVSAAQGVQACELDSSLLATPLETWRSMLMLLPVPCGADCS